MPDFSSYVREFFRSFLMLVYSYSCYTYYNIVNKKDFGGDMDKKDGDYCWCFGGGFCDFDWSKSLAEFARTN